MAWHGMARHILVLNPYRVRGCLKFLYLFNIPVITKHFFEIVRRARGASGGRRGAGGAPETLTPPGKLGVIRTTAAQYDKKSY